jgi:hypothetical protein
LQIRRPASALRPGDPAGGETLCDDEKAHQVEKV